MVCQTGAFCFPEGQYWMLKRSPMGFLSLWEYVNMYGDEIV